VVIFFIVVQWCMPGMFCMESDGAVGSFPPSEGRSSSVWLRRQKGSVSLAALTPPALQGWRDALVETEGGELWRILPTEPRLRKTEKFEK
jgi:hypothetical protein